MCTVTKRRNKVRKALEAAKPASSVSVILSGTVNASADRSVEWLPFPQLSVDTEENLFCLAFIHLRGDKLLFRIATQISSNVFELQRIISRL